MGDKSFRKRVEIRVVLIEHVEGYFLIKGVSICKELIDSELERSLSVRRMSNLGNKYRRVLILLIYIVLLFVFVSFWFLLLLILLHISKNLCEF